MAGGSNLHRKNFRRVDEGGCIWAELGEEIAGAVNNQKGISQLLDIGNEGEQAEGYRHHAEAEFLDRLASEFIYRKRCASSCSRTDKMDTPYGVTFDQESLTALNPEMASINEHSYSGFQKQKKKPRRGLTVLELVQVCEGVAYQNQLVQSR